MVPEGVLKRWTQGQQSAKRCSRLPRSLGDPAPAEVDWNKAGSGCLVIDHSVPAGLGKKWEILGEAKALLFAQPGRGRTDARFLKIYKYVCCDLRHKDASTHNFFNHSQFSLES